MQLERIRTQIAATQRWRGAPSAKQVTCQLSSDGRRMRCWGAKSVRQVC